MKNKLVSLFFIIFYLVLSFLFFIQSFGIIFFFDPIAFLNFFGIPSNILVITFFVILFWVGLFFFLPIFGSRVLEKLFPKLNLVEHENILDSIYQKFAKNAIILFFVLLFGGITFENFFNYPIGNFSGIQAPSWVLAWFFVWNCLFELINYLLIYKKKK